MLERGEFTDTMLEDALGQSAMQGGRFRNLPGALPNETQ